MEEAKKTSTLEWVVIFIMFSVFSLFVSQGRPLVFIMAFVILFGCYFLVTFVFKKIGNSLKK